MDRVRWVSVAVTFSLFLAGSSAMGGTARAATTYEVQVGAFLDEKDSAEWMGFLPGRLDIHSGDAVHFTSPNFHAISLLPRGAEPEQWLAENSAFGSGGDYTVISADPDEGEDMYKGPTAGLVKSRFDCGATGQPPCEFSGSGPSLGWKGDDVLSSGAPVAAPLDLSVRITAPAGETIYALCLLHPKTMRMPIRVVQTEEPATDPESAEAAVARTLADATKEAAKLHRIYSSKKVKRPGPRGTSVQEAWVGVERGPIALLGMYPKSLNVAKGDSVRWHFDEAVNESHSLTGPIEEALEITNQFPTLQCDLDTDSGSLPDVEILPPPVFCPGWLHQLEFDWPEGMIPPVGDGAFEFDLESSGIRGALVGDYRSFTLSFPRPSGPEGATFICLIHPYMRVKVVTR